MKKALMMACNSNEILRILSNKQSKLLLKIAPKIATPFTIYFYATNSKDDYVLTYRDGKICNLRHHIFTKNEFIRHLGNACLNGKIIGQATCDRITNIGYSELDESYIVGYETLDNLNLTKDELKEYGKGRWLTLIHVSNVIQFDKSKELKEFNKYCNDLHMHKYSGKHFTASCCNCIAIKNRKDDYKGLCNRRLYYSPQTFIYVDELEK